jgi:hypothetical protein
LYLFVAIRNPIWLPYPLISESIFNLLPRTIACEVTRLTTTVSVVALKICFRIIPHPTWTLYEVTWRAINVPLRVLKKCWYFLERFEIQDGRSGLWVGWTFFYFSTKTTSRLYRNVPMRNLNLYSRQSNTIYVEN